MVIVLHRIVCTFFSKRFCQPHSTPPCKTTYLDPFFDCGIHLHHSKQSASNCSAVIAKAVTDPAFDKMVAEWWKQENGNTMINAGNYTFPGRTLNQTFHQAMEGRSLRPIRHSYTGFCQSAFFPNTFNFLQNPLFPFFSSTSFLSITVSICFIFHINATCSPIVGL